MTTTTVTVMTSDGYSATGRGDPATASSALQVLDDFVSYLQSRVQTQDLDLLRRLGADYLCQDNKTLRWYDCLGANLICVLPFEHDYPKRYLPRARYYLARPKPNDACEKVLAFLAYLTTQLETHQMDVLRQCFEEFCHGTEPRLVAFLASGHEVVSIFPVLRPSGGNTSGSEEAEDIASSDHEAMGSFACLESLRSSSMDEDDHEDFDRGEDGSRARVMNSLMTQRRVTHQRGYRSSYKVRLDPATHDRLHALYREYEARAPWVDLFEDLPLPFREADAPVATQKLRFFWKHHRQAVWERNFWRPPHVIESRTEILARNNRQRQARKCFQVVIVAVYEALGAPFFAHLDAQPTRHPGWWFRYYTVDLWALCAAAGEQKCVTYVSTQWHVRFPDCGYALPLRSRNFGVILQQQQHVVVSASMWLQTQDWEAQAIRHSVREALAQAGQGGH